MVRTAEPTTVGINAQLLSTSFTFRSAGISHYLYWLLRELRHLQPPERILAYLSRSHLPQDLAPTDGFVPRLTGWPTQRPALRIAWEQGVLPGLLRRDRVGLLHAPSHVLPLAWAGPSVLTLHDLSFLLLPNTFPPAQRVYLRWMAGLAARRADQIIAVSESTRQDAIRLFGLDPRQVTRIYEGVDERFCPTWDPQAVTELKQRRKLPDRFLLYLGTIEPRKNLARLLDAYAILHGRGYGRWPLVLAGGPGRGHEAIVQHARALDLGDRVRFVGYVPESEAPLWYNAADLFVYPSLYEGFGLPVLEALASGTPVVASDRSSLPEIVGEAGILVDPTSAEAIAEAIQRVLDDEGLRVALATAGPVRAGRFRWGTTALETLSVYRAVRGG